MKTQCVHILDSQQQNSHVTFRACNELVAVSVVIIILTSIVIVPQPSQAACACKQHLPVLSEFYAATSGPSRWRTKWDNTTVDAPCDFYGYSCAGGLSLSSNGLEGTLPTSLGQLGTSIYYFIVDSNSLTGTLPASLGNWTNLQSFFVRRNNFTGTLPTSFQNWSYLSSFFPSYNSLSGTLPPEYGLGWRSSIVFFSVRNNAGINVHCLCRIRVGKTFWGWKWGRRICMGRCHPNTQPGQPSQTSMCRSATSQEQFLPSSQILGRN